MPLYLEKINGDVDQQTDRPTDRKLENRKRQRFAICQQGAKVLTISYPATSTNRGGRGSLLNWLENGRQMGSTKSEKENSHEF